MDNGELPPYRFVEINGLRLPSPEHAYTVCLDRFSVSYMVACLFSDATTFYLRMYDSFRHGSDSS